MISLISEYLSSFHSNAFYTLFTPYRRKNSEKWSQKTENKALGSVYFSKRKILETLI